MAAGFLCKREGCVHGETSPRLECSCRPVSLYRLSTLPTHRRTTGEFTRVQEQNGTSSGVRYFVETHSRIVKLPCLLALLGFISKDKVSEWPFFRLGAVWQGSVSCVRWSPGPQPSFRLFIQLTFEYSPAVFLWRCSFTEPQFEAARICLVFALSRIFDLTAARSLDRSVRYQSELSCEVANVDT